MIEYVAFNPVYPDSAMPSRRWKKGDIKGEEWDHRTRQNISFLWDIRKNDPFKLKLRYVSYFQTAGGIRISCEEVGTTKMYGFTFSEWDKIMHQCDMSRGVFEGTFYFTKKGKVFSLAIV